MKHLIIGTAGHIDHGKTSLIKLLTDIDCDTHKEEKARGITINLGFSHLELPSGESAGIIDVPGHKDFINTMIGGACGIDIVLLVIAADSGIMPQTAEHLNIISALGITKGVVALTKIDLVDDELLEIAKYEISEFLKNTSLKDAPIIGVSSATGKGKNELIAAIENTISLVEETTVDKLFRMYVDRIFIVKGVGSVVTGSVLGGKASYNDDLYLLPGDKNKLRVRSLERHGQAVVSVEKGDRAAINLVGLKNDNFERGMLISNKQLDGGIMADAYIKLFDAVPSLNLWSNVRFLSGTFECNAKMHLLTMDNLNEGQEAIVQLHFKRPAILINRDKFIIRNSSDDISLGGGYIIDASPLHHRRRTPELTETLNELCLNILSDNNIAENISSILKRELRPFDANEICEKLNITKEELLTANKFDNSKFKIYESNSEFIYIFKIFEDVIIPKIISQLTDYHLKNKIFANGLDTNEISGKLGFSKSKTGKLYAELLLTKMKDDGQLDNVGKTWIIKGHKAVLDKKTESDINWLETEFLSLTDEKAVLIDIEEKAINKGISKSNMKLHLSYLVGAGKLKMFNGEIIHNTILDKNRKKLLTYLLNKELGIDIPEYKEIIPGTKKFRGLLSDILESEKLIEFTKDSTGESRLLITDLGRKFLD